MGEDGRQSPRGIRAGREGRDKSFFRTNENDPGILLISASRVKIGQGILGRGKLR